MLAAARGGSGGGGGGNRGNGVGQSGCHDITSYPAIGYAGGACAGYGLLFDIRDAKNPKRLLSVADSNMSFWHSATFSNDGTKLLFSDEWGGGGAPRCRETDQLRVGRQRDLHARERPAAFQELLQDAGAAGRRRDLHGAQRQS